MFLLIGNILDNAHRKQKIILLIFDALVAFGCFLYGILDYREEKLDPDDNYWREDNSMALLTVANSTALIAIMLLQIINWFP